MKRLFLLPFVICSGLFAQQADIPLNSDLYHYIDRIDIQGLTGRTVHTDLKPYGRGDVAELFREANTSGMTAKQKEWFQLNRILGDDEFADSTEGKGIIHTFYKNKRDLFAARSSDYALYVNPVIYFSAGADVSEMGTPAQDRLLTYRNSRGAQLRGTAFKKLGFFTEVVESQAAYPKFIVDSYVQNDVLPGEAFTKPFKQNGYDFLSAKGYLTYKPANFMRIKLGKDRAFWGNGYQSLMLSDYAPDYFFLNITTRIWKLEYVNHFTQMVDYIRNKPDSYGTYPRKYSVYHQLAFKPNKNLSFSFYESIVYSPNLPGGSRGFELEYLNPIIFYRSTEQFLGSPDNSMMGITGKANFLKRFQGYGQIMLDDFNFGNRFSGKGYWGNKFGIQAGVKYIDAFGISGLDLQLEHNRIRPYTYSHFNPAANFSHYGQYLGHSMGANLYDFNAIVRYQPLPRLSAMLVVTQLKKGLDDGAINYGGDIFRPYSQGRPQEYNNFITQGVLVSVNSIYGRLSYRIMNLDGFFDLEARYRKVNGVSAVNALGSFRLNIPYKPTKF